MPAQIAADADATSASGQFDPVELASIDEFPPTDMQSSSEQNQPDVILDFDKVEPLESSLPLGTASFETEVSSQGDSESAGSGEGAQWFSQDHRTGRAIETPSTINARRNATTAPLNGQAAGFRMHIAASSEGST